MMTDEEEALLVMLAQQGDIQAFEQLLRRIHAPLRKFVTGMVDASTADDVLQETALKIYQRLKWLREPKVFRFWVYRIASRIAFVHLQREKRWKELDNDPKSMEGVLAPPSHDDIDSEFLSLVAGVSPASRAVILLHYQQHLSLEETAAVLDIPVGTAKSRLSYGVAQVRNFLMEKNKI